MNIENKNIEFKEKLVCVNRVSKTVKGGRIFSFTALTIIGNGNGKVGFGYGKSKEVPLAIKKSIEKAHNNLIYININNNKTILNESYGKYICSKVYIKPSKGTGIIAGNSIRAIFQLSGIKNVLTKIYGSTNPSNVIKATINALKNIKSVKFIAKKRGKSIKNILK